MKSKILLLDTSFSAKPIYDYLLTLDNDVCVLGGNSDDALAKSVNNYINLDYSNVADLMSFIKESEIDYLVPGGNDFSYKICSILNEELNFYNIDNTKVYETINNKAEFRKFAIKNKLSVPLVVNENDIKNNLPVIIKPVDAYSGHGMTVIYDYDIEVINQAVKKAMKLSKSDKYLIEQYVEGQLYSHSAFIANGEILQDFIVEENCIVNEYVVDTSRVVLDFNSEVLEQIRKEILKISKVLCLPDGLIHTQFICNDKKFWLIELTRRCPGDLYSKLIEESTGFPYAEFYAKPFLNIKNKKRNIALQKNNIIRHTITVDKKQIFNSFKLLNPIDEFEFLPLSKTGDILKESPFSRVGVLFAKLNDESESEKLFNSFLNQEAYKVS